MCPAPPPRPRKREKVDRENGWTAHSEAGIYSVNLRCEKSEGRVKECLVALS